MHRLDLKGMAGRLLLVFTLVLLLQAVHCSNSTGEDSGCYELTPPFYGVLVYNGSWIRGKNQPQWRENDTVTFLCDRGYELVRPSGASLGETWSVTCQASDAGSGSAEEETSSNGYSGTAWSGEPEQFRCTRINCGQPPLISNGSFSLDTQNSTDLFSTAQYTCDTGYQIIGADYSVCWWDGVWRPTVTCTFTSTATDCGDPPVIINGARTWTDGNQAPVGTTVAYSCDPGYERDGANEIVCTDSGDWSNPPNCTESSTSTLSSRMIYIIEAAGAAAISSILLIALISVCCVCCNMRIKQRRYVEDEEALANSGAFTLSNPLVTVKDEDAAGNPLYLTPDELNEFEQQQ